uniref:hypothetical protein n=1 Tax=Cellvibrio fontiphilus TaxID=1815559 RepID=UPI002B4BB960|nr:hypothetical protein [Cellvibrio fontiphilus]
MKFITQTKMIAFVMFFSVSARADNYCDVSRHSPTYGIDFNQVGELVWRSKPKVSVECGIIENIIAIRAGHVGEGHYKNVVLLVDQDDEKFLAVAKSGELTVYSFTSARGEVFYAAVKGNYAQASLLSAGALAVNGFADVPLPNGFTAYMPILERVL